MLDLAGGGRHLRQLRNPPRPPLDLSPDHTVLAAVNTADNRLLLFDVADGHPRPIGAVSVRLDPVSLRLHGNDEVWVVNQISDSSTPSTRRSRAGLRLLLASSRGLEPRNLGKPPRVVRIDAEDPRALAAAPAPSSISTPT